MLALIRPDSWNFPLFLHILGATVLFGTVATVAIAGFASRSHAGYEQLLARVAGRTFLFGVIPSFILMRAGAQWIVGKEFPGDAKTPGWVDVGFIVTEPGLIVLIAIGVIAFMSSRRGGGGRLATALAVLASIYLLALGVAMWAMTARPG